MELPRECGNDLNMHIKSKSHEMLSKSHVPIAFKAHVPAAHKSIVPIAQEIMKCLFKVILD